MRIKITQSVAGLDIDERGRETTFGFPEGKEFDVPARIADQLIKARSAVALDAPVTAPVERTVPEAAVLRTRERAVALPQPKSRRRK